VFVGIEPFLLEEKLSRLRNDFEGDASMNVSVFNGQDRDKLDIDEIVGLCNTLPFLAPSRMVVIRNAQMLNPRQVERIDSYLENPCETTSLVLCLEAERLDRDIERLLKKFQKRALVERFEPIRDRNERIRWIIGRARIRGKTMDSAASSLLADTAGSSLGPLDGEIAKLCLYVGARDHVGVQDVAAVVTPSVEPAIFAFMDALFDRRKEALARLQELEMAGMADLELVSRIENNILVHYAVLMGHDVRRLKVHSYTEQKALRRKPLWTAHELLWLLREIRSVERALKSGLLVSGYAALMELAGGVVLAKRSVPRGDARA